MHKLRAYQLQERGHDTVDANLELGLPADARDYGTGAQILADLGVRSMRLMTNNPDKRSALEGFGLEVTGRVPLPVHVTADNLRYLRTKRDRMGHDLPGLDPVDGVVAGTVDGAAGSAGSAGSAGTAGAAAEPAPDLDAVLAAVAS
jgi:3,4-dihydroxy 2-butanone 4-phosphate synthase/GTP cyclohydrolase II